MEKQIDLLIVDTKDEIVKTMNDSKLPLSVLSLMLHDIVHMVDNQLNLLVEKQREEYNKPSTEE